MVSQMDKNTIECVAQLQGKINYDAGSPISKDDHYARLINKLGSTSSLNVEDTIYVGINEDYVGPEQGNYVEYRVLKVANNPLTGFNAAILQDKDGTTILWADGSKGFDNIFNSPNPVDILKTLSELGNDWVINDLLGIGSGSIYPQLQQLKDFAEEFGLDKINIAIGQSMAGVSMSALAFTDGFEDIQFITYSGCLDKALYDKIASAEGWGLNEVNGANLQSYYTPGEPLLNILEPYKGLNKFYMKAYTDQLGFSAHGAEAYFNTNGLNSDYYEIIDFYENKFGLWQSNPRFHFEESPTGTGFQLQIKFSPDMLNKLLNMSNVSRDTKELMENLGINSTISATDGIDTYTVHDKYGIITRYNITNLELDNANPGLQDLSSDDGAIFLQKTDNQNKIIIPESGVKPVDYSPLVSEMRDIANGKEVITTDLPIQTDIYIPKSSAAGSPTLQDVYYQYTTKPSGGGILQSIITVVTMGVAAFTGNWWGIPLIALSSGIAGNAIASIANVVELATGAYGLASTGLSKIGLLLKGVPTGAAANMGYGLFKGSISTMEFAPLVPVKNIKNGISKMDFAQLLAANTKKYVENIKNGIATIGYDPMGVGTISITDVVFRETPKILGSDGGTPVRSYSPITGSYSGGVVIKGSNILESDTSTPDTDQTAQLNTENKGCPLSLDLDGDGIETLDIDKTNIYFNRQDSSEFSMKTGWISGDDGLLVVDRNNDGKITMQSELFGSETQSGFDALKAYDSNNDGVIDSLDTNFGDLKIWQDVNENGITDEGELKSLTERGIASINLNAVEISEEQNQNSVTKMSTYTTEDGILRGIYDVNLAFNKLYTQYTGDYELSVDVLDMPWLRGYGLVKDLQLKMSEDESFKNYVKELSQMTDAKAIYDKMDEFLAKWIGCEDILPNATVNTINKRHIEILNQYLNLGLTGELTVGQKPFIESSYISLKNKIYTNFIAQTQLGNEFEINYDYKTDAILYNDNTYEKLITNLPNQENFYASYIIAKVLSDSGALDGNKLAYTITEKGYGASLISYLNSGLQITDNGDLKLVDANTPMYVIGTSGDDTITGTDNADIIYGMDGDDILNGGAGDDYLSGGLGNDTLIGGDGNDTLDGGEGDDDLQGGYGDDTYIYDGQGKDTVLDERWVKIARQEWYQSGWWLFKTWKYRWVYQDKLVDAGNDTVVFGDNVKVQDIKISRSGNDLIFELNGTDNKLTIKEWYTSSERRVENFMFSDGFIINADQIMNLMMDTEGDDTISGTDANNFIISSSGNDVISAGKGDDVIINYSGNTAYHFNPGDGNDVIWDQGGIDDLYINFNVDPYSDIKYSRNDLDLIINIDGYSDSLTIKNWYADDENKIEYFWFLDESGYRDIVVDSMVRSVTATGYDDTIYGTSGDDKIDGLSGNDYIETYEGNDTIIGGLGKDIMKGGAGDDLYYVDHVGDIVIEEENEGTDKIASSVSYVLPDNVEQLTLAIGSNDINGTGNELDNVIWGNAGNNILDGCAGKNTLYGGKGDDTYIITAATANDRIMESADSGNDTVQSSITYTLSMANVENLVLTGEENINGTGNELDNYLEGNGGDNLLNGEAGNDTLWGNGGNDTLIGGTGDDTYIIDSTTCTVVENANEGLDTVLSSIDYTLGDNLENLILASAKEGIVGTGNELDNVIVGNDKDNTFIGGKGNDILRGGTGADTYIFNLGDGQDIIEENSPNSVAVDKIVFGEGINKDSLKFIRQGYDLIISIVNTNDKITIKNSNLSFGSRIDRFEFADGTYIDGAELYTLFASENKTVLYSDVSYLDINSKASTIEREYYDEGSLKSEIYYSDKALLESEKYYNEAGLLVHLKTYNADGLILKEILYSDAGLVDTQKDYIYNSSKQLTEIKNYIGDVLNTTEKFTYNKNGLNTKITTYKKATSVITGVVEFTYDSLNRISGQKKYTSSSSTIEEQIKYTYDAKGNLIRKLTEEGYNELISSSSISGNKYRWSMRTKEDTTYTYNENGVILKELTKEGYKELTSSNKYQWYTRTAKEVNYTYDSNGNITRKLTEVGYNKVVSVTSVSGIKYSWSTRTDEDIRYTYNSDGKILKELTYSGYPELVQEKLLDKIYSYYVYDTHLTREVNYTYSDNGYISTIEERVGYNKPIESVSGLKYEWSTYVRSKESYKYNDNNQISRITRYQSYGEPKSYRVGSNYYSYLDMKTRISSETVYTYNSDCQIIKEALYDYHYDANGNGTSQLAEEKTYKYDDEGRLILAEQYNYGKLVEAVKYDYIFDDNGYLIKQVIYNAVIKNNSISSYNKIQEVAINSYYDNLTGDANDNTLNGSNQIDKLFGGAGRDILYGYSGNDILDGGEDEDIMIGGKGDDTYFVDNINDKIIEHENEGNDTINTTLNYTLPANIENLVLSGADNLTGKGNSYSNTIVGNDGNNVLYGYAGNDIIDGGKGDDTIYGGDNNDIIMGSGGNDILYGEDGDDTYIFGIDDGIDVITDSSGKKDIVVFDLSVEKEKIAIYKDGEDLIIDYGETLGEDRVTIIDNSVEQIELADGSYISNTDVNQIIQNMIMYAQNNAIEFTGIDSVKNNADLMNLISVAWHS